MSVQIALEAVIRRLVAEFLQDPYAFFTEADAVSRFCQLLELNPLFSRRVQSRDRYHVSLVHRE